MPQEVIALADEFLDSPLLGDRVRVCVVTFADTAKCVLPLSDLTEDFDLPVLVPGRETRFGPVFELLVELTDADASAYMATGSAFYRPLLLLVTDGVPADPGWRQSFDRFYRHSHAHIILITLGIETAQAEEMHKAMRISDTQVLNDDPDQPLATQIEAALMSRLKALTTSRSIILADDR